MNLLRQFANVRVKKCTSILLVFLLLVSNTGLAFNVHYCGDSIASVSLKAVFAAAEKGCCGIAKKKMHCCKSKVVHFQKNSDNTIVKSFALQTAVTVPIVQWKPLPFEATVDFKGNSNLSYYCDSHAPPLFKLYSQYIFYDKF